VVIFEVYAFTYFTKNQVMNVPSVNNKSNISMIAIYEFKMNGMISEIIKIKLSLIGKYCELILAFACVL
jgi:hypothetical protein